MRHFLLQPEVAGGLGEETILDAAQHPPLVRRLHYEFEGWLGDDLLESFPCFIVTWLLGEALRKSNLSGFTLGEVTVTRSAGFVERYPTRELPAFLWLRVTGEPGVHDLSVAADASLIVSEAALTLLRFFSLQNCEVADWSPNSALHRT